MLSIRDLRKRYTPDGPWAVNGVDLNVEAGEFIAILGRSGAGKSTLIRCINRLVSPTSGRILWDDQDVLALDTRQLRAYRRQIGMIFQEFHLIERMDVLANVLVGRFGTVRVLDAVFGRFRAEDTRLAQEALARVELDQYGDRRASDLSGGQRQRVAIARALTQQPRLILGDEPVSNLDPATARSILSLLHRINRKDGITLVVNLHSVELARQYATRVLGMAEGQLVFDGPPEAVTGGALRRIYGDYDETGTRDAEEPAIAVPAGAGQGG